MKYQYGDKVYVKGKTGTWTVTSGEPTKNGPVYIVEQTTDHSAACTMAPEYNLKPAEPTAGRNHGKKKRGGTRQWQ